MAKLVGQENKERCCGGMGSGSKGGQQAGAVARRAVLSSSIYINPPGMPRLWYRQRQLWQLWRWCRPLPRLLLRSHLPPELVPL